MDFSPILMYWYIDSPRRVCAILWTYLKWNGEFLFKSTESRLIRVCVKLCHFFHCGLLLFWGTGFRLLFCFFPDAFCGNFQLCLPKISFSFVRVMMKFAFVNCGDGKCKFFLSVDHFVVEVVFSVWIWRIIIGIQYCCWRMTKIGKRKGPLLQYRGIWAYLLRTCLGYCLGKFCGKWPYGVSNRYCLSSILLLMVNG